MDLIQGRSLGPNPEIGHYFALRTVQPRFLALYPVLPYLVQSPTGTTPVVLDLACGWGHVGRAIHDLRPGSLVVGLNRTFHEAWLGRHWVAPDGRFVCADATGRLPFGDVAMSSAVCSDAFHLLPDSDEVMAEMRRCTGEGPIVLTRLANAGLEPHEGHERTPQGWQELAGGQPSALFAEADLIADYLAGRVAAPGAQWSPNAGSSKWLSLAVWARPAPDAPGDATLARAHARGRLVVNPAYGVTEQRGGLRGVLDLPSDWYAFENGQVSEYCAEGFAMTPPVVADLVAGRTSPEIDELVDRFVLVGAVSGDQPTWPGAARAESTQGG